MNNTVTSPTAILVERKGTTVLETDDKMYRITEKYKLWEKYFLDEKHKETFGNQTQSAIKAYGLDPEAQYDVAVTIGHQNIVKHKDLMKKYFSKKGWTYGKILEVYIEKMFKSPTPDLLYSFAHSADYPLPEYLPKTNPLLIKQYNTQINSEGGVSVYGNLTDEQLDAVIESKTRKIGVDPVTDGEREKNGAQPAEILETSLQAISLSDE